MLFSDYFQIPNPEAADWFNPLLSSDTSLFIDPFLLFDRQVDHFTNSHSELIAYFNYTFGLIADAIAQRKSIHTREVIQSLMLPEVEEICLGYGEFGTSGRGSGLKGARAIASGMEKAIRAGMTRLDHFESVGLFEPGFGADKISDACAYILRHKLGSYTEEIASELSLKTREVRYRKAKFDPSKGRWQQSVFNLPMNPYNGKPILLVPKEILRELPTINVDDFYEYCVDNENETLRLLFGQEVLEKVKKSEIIRKAAQTPSLRERYIKQKETRGSEPYDLKKDQANKHQWYHAAANAAATLSTTIDGSSEGSFHHGIVEFANDFKNFIENNGGWHLLRNDNNTGRKESASQKLFQAMAISFCRTNDIDLSPEVNAGRGPVDFKFSKGWARRVLIEVKLARSDALSHGFEKQLPTYLKAERIRHAIYIIIAYNASELTKAQRIIDDLDSVKDQLPCKAEVIVVEAWKPPSASKS